jgi:hypothetical protein
MTEKDAQSRLECLVRKPRSEAKTAQVRSILAAPGDTGDKVIRLELLDQLPDAAAPAAFRGPLVRPERRADPKPAAGPAAPTEIERVALNRAALAAPVKHGGWWSYFTREYRAMLWFGVETATLRTGLFPFTLKLTAFASTLASQTLPEQVLPVLNQWLPLVLRRGWAFLTIAEYNLLAVLARLATRAAAPLLTGADPELVAALILFRVLPEAEARTLEAWNTAAGRLGVPEPARLAGTVSIRTLLSGSHGNSFPDLVRALLMLRARRAVGWNEVEPKGDGPFFAATAFDCTAEVREQIDAAVKSLKAQRETLDREFLELRRMHFYLPEGPLLDEFVQGQDRSDPIAWCQKFLEAADAALGPLLGGQVALAGGGTASLFADPVLASSLSRLDVLRRSMPTRAADQGAWQAAVAKMVMNLGKVLVVVIRARSVTADPLARAEGPSEVSDPLSHEESLLVSPVPWAGMSVIEALIRAARVCLLAGRFLGDTSLEANLEKQPELEARAARVDAELARLCPTIEH